MPLKVITKPKIRVSELPQILRGKSKVSDSVESKIQLYVFALMVAGYPKTLTNIAAYFGATISGLSRLLSHPGIGAGLDIHLNRQTRGIIAAYLNRNNQVSVDIIIDATLIERSSRKAENVGLYHSNGKKTLGHRVTNVGMLLDSALYIPLASIPHYTRKYVKLLGGLNYSTEGIMVRRWLRDHIDEISEWVEGAGMQREDVTFLLDAGYDNKLIQKAIISSGCHFLMMIKSSRKVAGFQVKEFFKKNRWIKWQSIRITRDSKNKKKRLDYRIRTAEQVELNGVGLVNVVCSEKKARGRGQKSTRRFLVSSRENSTGREIIKDYRKRWTIETWHKTMKQSYGFGDCSVSSFSSMENHFKMCNIAYLSHLQGLKSLPMKGTSIEDYLQLTIRKEARHRLTKFSGHQRFTEELEKYRSNIFSAAA